jgi:hypothetical protein
MEKLYPHVLVSRSWFHDMFMQNSKFKEDNALEIFEAVAAYNDIVVKFSSSISFDDGFLFVYPRKFPESQQGDVAEKFTSVVDHCNTLFTHEFNSTIFDYKIEVFTMASTKLHSFIFRQLNTDGLRLIVSMLSEIISVNPDVAHRYHDNHAVFAYALKQRIEGKEITQKTLFTEALAFNRIDFKKPLEKYMFDDASHKVSEMFKKYDNNSKLTKIIKNPYTNGLHGWRSEIDNDGTSGYLNVQRAADNVNREFDEE